MSLMELAARVSQYGAKAALVISIWKGNPGVLRFTSSSGVELVTIKVESVKLRREVNPTKKNRIIRLAGIFIASDSSKKTRDLGEILASFLDVGIFEIPNPDDAQVEENSSLIWLEDQPSGKILWTHYHSTDRVEIGPRIRVSSIRRSE
ncbi:MAG: hypothetical protein ACFFBL_03520 [Promethearchaeota archaeon]